VGEGGREGMLVLVLVGGWGRKWRWIGRGFIELFSVSDAVSVGCTDSTTAVLLSCQYSG